MRSCCTQEREGAQGKVYSYEMLGVLCPNCEWEAEQEYEQRCWEDRRAAMTQAERDREDIDARWWLAVDRLNSIASRMSCRYNIQAPGVARKWASHPF